MRSRTLAICAATFAVAAVPAALASRPGRPAVDTAHSRRASALTPSPTRVSVRIEGLKKTLLAATVVRTRRGWIRKGGTPTGACPAAGGAGALDVATRHRWNGTWNTKYATLLLTSIKGERHGLAPFYWSIWVNDAYAQSGICGITLHRGDRLLFAAVPDTPAEFPIALRAPRTATVGRRFTVKSFWFDAAGRRKPLGGVRVRGGGIDTLTNSRGVATITVTHTGSVRLRAARAGYIRAAAVVVHATG